MARQAEAERERRAKVINAEGEYQASERLRDAAAVMSTEPIAIQLRYLQTLLEIGSTNSSTIVFPAPIDLIQPLLERAVSLEAEGVALARAAARPALRAARRGRAGAGEPAGRRPARRSARRTRRSWPPARSAPAARTAPRRRSLRHRRPVAGARRPEPLPGGRAAGGRRPLPRHARSLAELEPGELALVAEAWQLGAPPSRGTAYLHALVNEGATAGSSLPHSHSQLAWLHEAPAGRGRRAGRLRRRLPALPAAGRVRS